MSIEFGKAKELTRKVAKFSSAPVVFASALIATGCGDVVDNTNFPQCAKDPQSKSQTIRLSDGGWGNSALRDHIAKIDGVTLKLSEDIPRRVDIEAEEDRVKVVKGGYIQFNGKDDGRLYEVTFPASIITDEIKVNVQANCK
ncbi:MAG: hypothetical protein UU23_C0001G0092 [Candidatus Curtissbacteria bacterium GW2011_GWA1_40_9]|uniref:Lipoprotein n=1 Tax=Candidatus Curtissbacteria bacterium GW2011_GWA1_40_9 TaxID=1618408 RepID=A0A0G0TMV6_9BACT|nr:MAG: hypothetical protein UU23_C0001G0092 [Candidatus Curtissbacteria bacterium GW2011_GWA1_40_9]